MPKLQKTEQELFPFIEGLARIFDLRSNFVWPSHEENFFEIDAKALKADWVLIGRDGEVAVIELKRIVEASAPVEELE